MRVAQAGDGTGYPINILEEDALGGHTIERHVGKSEQYLKARVLNSRVNIPYIGAFGEKRAGSFTSLEAANKLVNSVLSSPSNVQKLMSFTNSPKWMSLGVLYLYPEKMFDRPTGYEAYTKNGKNIVVRSTYSIEIQVFRTDRNQRGFYVNSAYPINED